MTVENEKSDEQFFEVKIPESATQIIGICFGFISVLFVIFLVMFLFKAGGVTRGNLYVCIIMNIIFGLLMLQFKTWKLTVREDELCVQGIYRKKCVFKFSDINEVIVGRKNELEIYVDHKKVTTIDISCLYYDELFEQLKNKGCKIRVKEKTNVKL